MFVEAVNEIMQQANEFSDKSNYLSSNSRILMVEGENHSQKLPFDLHTYVILGKACQKAHKQLHVHTHK